MGGWEEIDVKGSSRVSKLEYDAQGQRLRATFRSNGKKAIYSQVPVGVAQRLKDAESVGSAFGQYVVKGGYSFEYV